MPITPPAQPACQCSRPPALASAGSAVGWRRHCGFSHHINRGGRGGVGRSHACNARSRKRRLTASPARPADPQLFHRAGAKVLGNAISLAGARCHASGSLRVERHQAFVAGLHRHRTDVRSPVNTPAKAVATVGVSALMTSTPKVRNAQRRTNRQSVAELQNSQTTSRLKIHDRWLRGFGAEIGVYCRHRRSVRQHITASSRFSTFEVITQTSGKRRLLLARRAESSLLAFVLAVSASGLCFPSSVAGV
jgi:hypothetical protein